MTAIGIEAGAYTRATHITLADEFRARDIPILPTRRVLLHKESLAARHRTTWVHDLVLVSSIVLRWTVWMVTLLVVPVLARRVSGKSSRATTWCWVFWTLAVAAAFTAGITLSLNGYGFFWWLAGCVPVVLSILSGLYEVVREGPESQRFAQITGYWWAERVPSTQDLYGIRPQLRARAERVSLIPGARIYREVLNDDPFLYAERGFGPLKERVYFGAYDTHNHELDNF